jgi:hypothetical protein
MDVGQPYLLADEVSKMLVRIIVTLPFLPCFVVAEPVEAATFIYTLSSELKKPNCAYDYDNDCLDDAREQSLAWIAAPHYFYDEDEEYAYAPYTDASSSYDNLHFRRKDFFQVRPFGDPASWSPTSSSWKQVQIVYFFLHPHDGGIGGGHQGDGERVKFVAKSQDLKRWQITSGLYDAHGKHFYYSASYLGNIADSIGSSHPSVAADENSHGSWPGKHGNSSHCAGSEDSFCWGTCDCFRGKMGAAYRNGYWEFPAVFRNIGGPLPEYWNADVLTVRDPYKSGIGLASSTFNVGHGLNEESWSLSNSRFCGWECSRREGGDCAHEVHGSDECSTPLAEKPAYDSFVPNKPIPIRW